MIPFKIPSLTFLAFYSPKFFRKQHNDDGNMHYLHEHLVLIVLFVLNCLSKTKVFKCEKTSIN